MVLEMKDIHKSFGNTQVLKGISMNVDSGEVVSIIGPSGSGKSTLLLCATFLENINAGEIRYLDKAAVTTSPQGAAEYVSFSELQKIKQS